MTDKEINRLFNDIKKDEIELHNMIKILFIPRCIKCGKKLTDRTSRLRGYGPVCWEKLVNERQENLF